MPRCPACESFRVVIVLGAKRRSFCVACGARWVQDGSLVRQLRQLRRARAVRPTVEAEPTPA